MAAELWAVAAVGKVQETIAQCRRDPAAREALGEEFVHTYTSFSGSGTPGYWNRYLTWVTVQMLAVERWPDLQYSLRDAALLVSRFLNETTEESPAKGTFKLWRARPRSLYDALPEVAAVMQLLGTVGGAAAETRAATLSPDVDPNYNEEGALYFEDHECRQVLTSLAALRTFFIDPPYGSQFHFWVARQPSVPRTLRDALTLPNTFLGDLSAIFSRAQAAHAQVFFLWAP